MYMHVAWSLGKRILFRVNLCHLNNFPFPKRHLKKEKFNTEMEPSKKKRKVTVTPKSSNEEETASFVKSFEEDRKKIAKSVLEFNFNKKRIKILTDATEVKANSGGIVYWMSRDGRVQDNWAFLLAQKLALKNQIPLYVCFCLVTKFLDATLRPYKFLLKGLSGVQTECEKLDISFHLLHGLADKMIPKFVQKHNIGGVVCDFSPLRVPMQWVEGLKQKLPIDIPLCQVDAHNVVPVWTTSTKQEYAARTIRNKINGNLNVFLTPFPPVVKHPYKSETKKNIDWEAAISFLEVDKTVDEVDWARPGYEAGVKMLEDFCNKRLKIFSTKRNDPLVNALSNLSPWFHFGQISVQRSILAVQKYKSNYPDSVAAFCEEAIVRRELSDNFCYYNKNYDNLEGIPAWAKQTLNDHRLDKRNYVYSLKQLDDSKTHDDLWNAAQVQLRREGKMHGFLRMYWAKKILEWTKKPEDALSHAIYLNDRYSLDGRDPNGYVGCMWSIGGVHDQGWAERAIFGKIRFMNYDGCKRKFDVKAFVARYGNKA